MAVERLRRRVESVDGPHGREASGELMTLPERLELPMLPVEAQ